VPKSIVRIDSCGNPQPTTASRVGAVQDAAMAQAARYAEEVRRHMVASKLDKEVKAFAITKVGDRFLVDEVRSKVTGLTARDPSE